MELEVKSVVNTKRFDTVKILNQGFFMFKFLFYKETPCSYLFYFKYVES